MTVAERKAICEMLVRMERQKEFSKKIGLVDKSILKQKFKSDKNEKTVKYEEIISCWN